ncbi:MAG TPA: NAD-dependent epimerase/dehydratase family protein [Chthoniobacterales bacterium]
MRRILIAGCGYVGSAAADLFHSAGWSVEGWTHSEVSAARLLDKPYPVTAVDLSDRHQVNGRSQNFDLVIHCASTGGGDEAAYRRLYLNGISNLLDRFVGSTLLFTSSTSVYAQRDGELVNEQSPAQPGHEKGQLLLETENLVLGRGGIIARVGGIHGPGRSATLKRFLGGEAQVDPDNDRFMNNVHRDDIAAALLLLADPSTRQNAVYNVVDDSPILRSECYRWLAQKLGRPTPSGRKAGGSAKRGRSNKRVSNLKLRECGWMPRYATFAAAMEQSILPSFGL